jgi:hypothetical protein
MQVKNERPMRVGCGGIGGGQKQQIREMHRVTGGGIEHMGALLTRWRSTLSNADGYQKRHEAD